MSYICNECGHLIDRLPSYRYHGDNLLGGYMDEVDNSCQVCNLGQYQYAESVCAICGEPNIREKLYRHICEECLAEYAIPEYAIEYGQNRMCDISVNGFIRFALTDKEINEILMKHINLNPKKYASLVKKYCFDDKADFAEFILEE